MGLTQRVDSKALEVSKTQFEVLRLLQSNLTITQISISRKVSRASVYKVIKTLIHKGYLEKIDKSFSLTTKGIEGLHSFVGLRYKLRQHNFHVKFKVLDAPKNWAKKRNEFRKLPYFNKRIKLKNNEQELFNYGALTIKTTTKSIIIKIPTIYAKNIDEATLQTFGIIESTYPKIENLFKVKLVKNYKSCMEVVCQEFANLNDVLARIYNKRGEQLLITGEDEKIWMITDKSFNGDEREYVHPIKAADDEPAISTAMNILRDEPTIMKENQSKVNGHDKILGKSMKVLEGYAEQIALHLRVEQKQEKHLKNQTKLFEEIRDFMRSSK